MSVNLQRVGGSGSDANDVTSSIHIPAGKTLTSESAPDGFAATDLSGATTQAALTAVSVLAFGVATDGTTDSSTALQAAIDSGMPLFVPFGVVVRAKDIILRTGTRLYGPGTIKLTDAANVPLFTAVAVSDIELGGGLILDGNSAGQTGYGALSIQNYGLVWLRVVERFRAERITITGSRGSAINGVRVNDSMISKCRFLGGYIDPAVVNVPGGVLPPLQVKFHGYCNNNEVVDCLSRESDVGFVAFWSESADANYPDTSWAAGLSYGNIVSRNIIDRAANHTFPTQAYYSSGYSYPTLSLKCIELGGQMGARVLGNVYRAPRGGFVAGFDTANSRVSAPFDRHFHGSTPNGVRGRFYSTNSDAIPVELQSGYFYTVEKNNSGFKVSATEGGAAIAFSAPVNPGQAVYFGEAAGAPGFISLGSYCIRCEAANNSCIGGIVENPLECNGGSSENLFASNDVEMFTSAALGGGSATPNLRNRYINNRFGQSFGASFVNAPRTLVQGNEFLAPRQITSTSDSQGGCVIVTSNAAGSELRGNTVYLDHDQLPAAAIFFAFSANGVTGLLSVGNRAVALTTAQGGTLARAFRGWFVTDVTDFTDVDFVFDGRQANGTVVSTSVYLVEGTNTRIAIINPVARNYGATMISDTSTTTDFIAKWDQVDDTSNNYRTYYQHSAVQALVGVGGSGTLAVVGSGTHAAGVFGAAVEGLRVDATIGADALTAHLNHNGTLKRVSLAAASGGKRALQIDA